MNNEQNVKHAEDQLITNVISKLQSASHDLTQINTRMHKLQARLMGDFPVSDCDKGGNPSDGDLPQLTHMANEIIQSIEETGQYLSEFEKL